VGARQAEKIVKSGRHGGCLLLLGAVIVAGCSRSPDSSGSGLRSVKPLMSQADADKLVAERFPIDRYVVHDFIPKPGEPPPPPITPARPLKIGLYWVMNDELTPWYVAEAKGFFSALGLNVELVEGGPGRNNLSGLLAGRVDVYIGPAEEALFVINSRTGADQVSTRHIGRADLIGSRIAMQPDGDFIMDIVCSELNIPPDQIHLVPAGSGPDGLLTGTVDYYAGFRTNQPRVLERNGYKNWTYFPYSDVGLRDYFDVSIVNADFYRSEPKVLANYVYALNEAIEYEMAHPEEAADIVVRYTPQYPVTKEEVLRRMKQDFPVYRGDGSEPLLAMKDSVVQHQLAMLYRYRQVELLPASADAQPSSPSGSK
jgi:ABC-type nitrate/sulfonate/bicarbonate transport system substrate-binding protein